MKNDLIGLTINEAITILKKKESFFQYCVVVEEHKEHNFKKSDSKVFYHDKNGKRAYRIIKVDSIIYAENKTLENDSFIINVKIEKGQADNWSFNGYVNTTYHNVYYFFVDHLKSGNKGHKETIKKEELLSPFTDEELKKVNHRFTL